MNRVTHRGKSNSKWDAWERGTKEKKMLSESERAELPELFRDAEKDVKELTYELGYCLAKFGVDGHRTVNVREKLDVASQVYKNLYVLCGAK